MAIILLAYGPCVVIVNLLRQVCTLGRAPRTKETLLDFREWFRVTRHPRIFRRLTSCQRTPRFWGVTTILIHIQKYIKVTTRPSCHLSASRERFLSARDLYLKGDELHSIETKPTRATPHLGAHTNDHFTVTQTTQSMQTCCPIMKNKKNLHACMRRHSTCPMYRVNLRPTTQCKCQWEINTESVPTPITQPIFYVIFI